MKLKKIIEKKVLVNIMERIIVDRVATNHSVFFFSLLWKSNTKVNFDKELVVINLVHLCGELENVDLLFCYKKEKEVEVIITLRNFLGIKQDWAVNLKNKLITWFGLHHLLFPAEIQVKKNENEFFNSMQKTQEYDKDLVIYNFASSDSEWEAKLLDFTDTYKGNAFYFSKFNVYSAFNNKLITSNKKLILINLLNCYLTLNELVIYRTSLLKKITGSKSSWEYSSPKEFLFLEIKNIIHHLKTTLLFQLEYFQLEYLLLEERELLVEIIGNADFYLENIITFDSLMEFKNGNLLVTGEFISYSAWLISNSAKKTKLKKKRIDSLIFSNKNYNNFTYEELKEKMANYEEIVKKITNNKNE